MFSTTTTITYSLLPHFLGATAFSQVPRFALMLWKFTWRANGISISEILHGRMQPAGLAWPMQIEFCMAACNVLTPLPWVNSSEQGWWLLQLESQGCTPYIRRKTENCHAPKKWGRREYKLTIFLLHCVDLSGSSLISLASKDYTHIVTVWTSCSCHRSVLFFLVVSAIE